jgi:hypothetical protein
MEMELNGCWTGLAGRKEARTSVDYFLIPGGWQKGFDIIFRMKFIARVNNFDSPGLKNDFMGAFKSAFQLDDDLSRQNSGNLRACSGGSIGIMMTWR